MLSVENLDAGYGKAQALNDVSLTVKEGEVTLLMGTNGSGKTTLMRCITGLLKPWSGNITYEGDGKKISLGEKSPEDIIDRGIISIPDERAVFPELTVRENLMIGSYRKGAREKAKGNLRDILSMFPQLKKRENQIAGTLSGGEKQMVAVGKALMAEPKFLLMDEPSIGLAPILVKELFSKISTLKEEYELTVLLTEQNIKQSSKIGDRMYLLVNGEITFEGDTKDLRPEKIRKRYLGV